MLALPIAAVHIAGQGGVTALDSPAWIGRGYRIIEARGACPCARSPTAFAPRNV